VAFCRNLKTPVLCDLEKNGMTLDPIRVKEEHDKLSRMIIELEIEMAELTGGINVKSAPQMREFLYETLKFKPPKDYKGKVLLTPKGEIATNAIALASLKATTQKQKKFLELRNQLVKAKDAMSKYVGSMMECCRENEGHLEGKFNPTVTTTHRLSSGGKKYKFQLQNIPRAYKRLFKARYEGWKVAEVDYPQLEFRTAVDIARDEQGLLDIQNNEDIHAFTATILFGSEFTEADPEGSTYKGLRTKAKAHSFKPLIIAA
jgi:DNA polymerase-1